MTIHPRLFEVDAQSRLGQIEVKARRCVEKAEQAWNGACAAVPHLRIASRGRGRNSIFNELVVHYAREEFEGDFEVSLCERYGTVRLHVGDDLDLGFKKVDAHGRHSNYPTRRQLRYGQQMRLFGEPMADAVRLHIGYQWNRAGTEIVDVSIIYPYQRTVLWKYSCREDEGIERAIPMPQPAARPAVAARFRSKKRKEAEAPAKDLA